ncbi:MAG: PASTA domain-containing protein [Alistipes sp.]|nr:PASTA domain-containing protein [Alistipes sp.]
MKQTANNDKGIVARCKRHPILFNLALIALAVLTLALAAHLVMQVATRHGSRNEVPDFTGIRLADAERLASGRGLRLRINDSLFVASYDGGIVLDQLPEAGTTVKDGRTVYITINAFGQKMVDVPYVAGRSLRQAKNMLEIAGLGIERLVYRSDMATNYVQEQWYDGRRMDKDARVQAPMGSGVTLYVGAEAGSATVVPKVVGLTLQAAKSRLWESGLNVGRVEYDNDVNRLNRDEATVYAQGVGAGIRATLGGEVSLRLTLDTERVASASTAADKALLNILEQRRAEEGDTAAGLSDDDTNID